MSCCGNKRTAFSQPTAHPPTAAGRALTPVSLKMWTDLHFANTGEAPVTVSGPVTGKLYRWAGNGDIQVVDYRDAGALRHQLKVLKRVK
ncbi:MAG TPA: hypothetical protein VNS58_00730 [Puia sp.]|nr:hypothetical protein [Puia sp.]